MRALRNIMTLMMKEFRSLFGDPTLIILIVFVFTGAIVSVAKGISTDVKNATVGIIDLDRSVLSYQIRDAIQPPFFQTPKEITREQLDELMDKGEYIFVLEIPPEFERDVLAGRSPEINLLIDATVMTQAGVGSSYLTQIINREVNAFAAQSGASPVNAVIRQSFNPNGESTWFMPVMEVGSMVTMITLVLVGAAVIRERERGTIEHLLVMPVSAFELMMSKILANGAVILTAAVLSMWFVVHEFIGVPLHGSLLLYAAGVTVYLFSIASLGIMLATVAPTMAQFGLLMLPVYIVMLLFSGASSPRANMPEFARAVSEYWPLTQFAQFAQNVLFRGAGLNIVWPQMAVMAVLGAAFLGFALFRFRKMLEQQG
ncbi:ABC-2 type transport system permease protein [Neisseria perflava]|uniref:ABC transporter permease n=1 Tax=Neisseria perflava TaxID=33053 RepID=UPI00209DBC35|nr:ABC transporter permease [Neisseria perflava]MCP1771855.1 ABC-2 type transport system permease protein [Neisseria perflava]